MIPPLVTVVTTLVLFVVQLPKSGCGRAEENLGVLTRMPSVVGGKMVANKMPSMMARGFTRDSDYPLYRVVTRTKSPSDSDDDDEVEEGQRGVTQAMGGEPYTGGLEHRLAHVKKFGSFAGRCFSFIVK